MSKFIYSFFILSLLVSLYGCAGSNTASSGINLGNKKIGMIGS
jgi:hypothetical protein